MAALVRKEKQYFAFLLVENHFAFLLVQQEKLAKLSGQKLLTCN